MTIAPSTTRVAVDPVTAAAAAITAATATPPPPVVDRLRTATDRDRGPSLGQVTAIVDGVLGVIDRDTIAANVGLDPEDVMSCVAQLGTWLRHVRGPEPFTLVKAAELDQPMLWQPAPVAGEPVRVIIPAGFERAGTGRRRDVTKALGSLVASRPTGDELARWVARQTPATTDVVDWSLVTMVHTFARLGRIEELDQINGDSAELSRALCRAWDLLETARVTALEAAGRVLCDLVPAPADLATARVLHEAGFARFERLLSARSDLLDRERRRLAGLLLDGSLPASVAELSSAQVRRIAEAAGLTIEGPNRTEEGELRRRLDDLGLGADVDQLLPAASRAIAAGLADAFWEAMQMRADGEEDWQAPLRAATADLDG